MEFKTMVSVNEGEKPKISKGILKTAERYVARMLRGEKIMRDARGQLQWSDGRKVGAKTVQFLLSEGRIAELDTDLFGDFSRGQTLGLPS
jgi:hypothetical protein